jgi:hypothetical protein
LIKADSMPEEAKSKSSGSERTFGFVLGHEAGFCEVVENGILYRVPREAFFNAIAGLESIEACCWGHSVAEQGVEPSEPAVESTPRA